MNKYGLLLSMSLLVLGHQAAALTEKQVFWWTNALAMLSGGLVYCGANPYPIFPGYEERAYMPEDSMTTNAELDIQSDAVGMRITQGKAHSIKVRLPAKFDNPLYKKEDANAPLWKKVGFKKGYTKPFWCGIGTFVAVHAVVGRLLAQYTPTKRYAWAQEQLEQLQKEYLFKQEITPGNFGQILQESGCEAHEFPLVSAFLTFQRFDNQLTAIAYQLNCGIRDTDNASLAEKMAKLLIRVTQYLKNVRANEAFIKNNDPSQWLEQWKIYQQGMIEREKIAAQSAQVHAHTHIVYVPHA